MSKTAGETPPKITKPPSLHREKEEEFLAISYDFVRIRTNSHEFVRSRKRRKQNSYEFVRIRTKSQINRKKSSRKRRKRRNLSQPVANNSFLTNISDWGAIGSAPAPVVHLDLAAHVLPWWSISAMHPVPAVDRFLTWFCTLMEGGRSICKWHSVYRSCWKHGIALISTLKHYRCFTRKKNTTLY